MAQVTAWVEEGRGCAENAIFASHVTLKKESQASFTVQAESGTLRYSDPWGTWL